MTYEYRYSLGNDEPRELWSCDKCGKEYEQIRIRLIFPKKDEKDENNLI